MLGREREKERMKEREKSLGRGLRGKRIRSADPIKKELGGYTSTLNIIV